MPDPAARAPGDRGRLRPPVFEIGLKGYAWGAPAVHLAREADRLSAEYGVTVIFDPQAVDIPAVAAATSHLRVFAQHMDPVAPGRGAGAVLAEAIRDAGAHGTMLNHSERRMTLADINGAIRRADEVGLSTMVCADSPEEAAAIALLGPDIVLAEPPELIATSRSAATEMQGFVERTIELVGRIDPRVIVMCSAGIHSGADVARMIELGAGGTGSSSGVLRAADPVETMASMIGAMRDAWAARQARVRPDGQATPVVGRTASLSHGTDPNRGSKG